MQLRSGNSTMRRDSRNYDEFEERKRYQQEQKELEDTIYDEQEDEQEDEDEEFTNFTRKIRHTIAFLEFQKKSNCHLVDKVKTFIELYALIKNNLDYIYVNKLMDKTFASVVYRKGKYILDAIESSAKTRYQSKLYSECKELIEYVIGDVYCFIFERDFVKKNRFEKTYTKKQF